MNLMNHKMGLIWIIAGIAGLITITATIENTKIEVGFLITITILMIVGLYTGGENERKN